MAFINNGHIENNYISGNLEKLYLDSKTADVFFEFDINADQPVRVPAHRSLLAVDSPVFKKLFYETWNNSNVIKIDDVSIDTFKVFLQFFYLTKVNVTPENLPEVSKIWKKYELNDFSSICSKVLNLTPDDICTNYRSSVLKYQREQVDFWKEKILENPDEIINSQSFLTCNQRVFSNILEIVHSECSALDLISVSLRWAKTKCKGKKLDETPINLRRQFGDIFDLIPFEKLTIEQFLDYIKCNNEFFRIVDLFRIFKKFDQQLADAEKTTKAPKRGFTYPIKTDHTVEKVTQLKKSFICFRSSTDDYKEYKTCKASDAIQTNKRFVMTGIQFTGLPFDRKLTFIIMDSFKRVLSTGYAFNYGLTPLSKPITIEPGYKYTINVASEEKSFFNMKRPIFTNHIIQSDLNGIQINFCSYLVGVVKGFNIQEADN